MLIAGRPELSTEWRERGAAGSGDGCMTGSGRGCGSGSGSGSGSAAGAASCGGVQCLPRGSSSGGGDAAADGTTKPLSALATQLLPGEPGGSQREKGNP